MIGPYPSNQVEAAVVTVLLVAGGIAGFLRCLYVHTHRVNDEGNRATAVIAATAGALSMIASCGPEMFLNPVVTGILAAIGLIELAYAFWVERQPVDPPDPEVQRLLDREDIPGPTYPDPDRHGSFTVHGPRRRFPR